MHTITDSDLGMNPKPVTKWKERNTVRAVLLRDEKIAIMHFQKTGIYMLPGGAIETDESILDALHREVQEETGSTIKILQELGTIKELRSHIPRRQLAHGFLCQEIAKGNPSYTKKELDDEIELLWFSPKDAIELFNSAQKPGYNAHFHAARDLKFLELAKPYIDNYMENNK